MANRVWDELSRTFEGPGRTPSKPEARDTVAEAVRVRCRALDLDLADAVNVALAADYDTDAIPPRPTRLPL
jgi:hypothetical protein